jgi:translation elongation factor EF-Ts
MYTQTAVPAAVMSRVVSTHVAMHVAMHVAVSNGKYQSDKTVTERRIR